MMRAGRRAPLLDRLRRVVGPGVVLATCALALVAGTAQADDETAYRGRLLIDVLHELQDAGLEMIFSSAVVSEDLRIRNEPVSTTPREILDEILPQLGLKAVDGPAGSLLILAADAGDDTAGDPAGPGASGRRPLFVTEVIVTPSQHSLILREQATRRTVTDEEAVLAPTLAGDVAKVVELLPGVAAPDGSATVHVRGSVARDVSLVLDGLELYDPYHLHGFHSPFSLVDSNVVDRIDFFGGGFTADLGDRHGAFVDIATSAPESAGGPEIELGTLNSRVSHHGLLANGSGAWLVSSRAWYPETVVHTSLLGRGENLDPRFADVYAKATFAVAPGHRLSAHGLLAYDRLQFQELGEDVNESADAKARSAYFWLRARSAWSKKHYSETVFSVGRIERLRDGISSIDEAVVVDDDRVVDFVGLGHDSTWQISDAHAIKAGTVLRWLGAEYRYSNVNATHPDLSRSFELDPGGASFAGYVAHRARVTPRFATELGARWDRQAYADDKQLSPRFNAVWRPHDRSEARLALGRFSQSQRIHELHVEDGETDFSRAEISDQAELSFQHDLAAGPRVRVDVYYKKLTRLRPRFENLFEPFELFPETTQDRVRLVPDEARLRGVELLLRGKAGRPVFWWVSYARSSAEDSVDGRYVPRSWDQPHAGRFLVGYRRDERWSVSLSGQAHSGWPTTPVLAEVTTLPGGATEIEAVAGERNTDRFSGYVRLDFKARRSFRLPRGRLWLTLDVVNLTDRANPCCLNDVFFEQRPDGSIDVIRTFDDWLGTTPSLTVLWQS